MSGVYEQYMGEIIAREQMEEAAQYGRSSSSAARSVRRGAAVRQRPGGRSGRVSVYKLSPEEIERYA